MNELTKHLMDAATAYVQCEPEVHKLQVQALKAVDDLLHVAMDSGSTAEQQCAASMALALIQYRVDRATQNTRGVAMNELARLTGTPGASS